MVKIQDANQTFERETFDSQCELVGCDPTKGLTLEAVKSLWKDDADTVYEIVKKDEKMRQMFRWADKDWNGFLDRKEAESLQLLSTPGFVMTPEMWNAFAAQCVVVFFRCFCAKDAGAGSSSSDGGDCGGKVERAAAFVATAAAAAAPLRKTPIVSFGFRLAVVRSAAQVQVRPGQGL